MSGRAWSSAIVTALVLGACQTSSVDTDATITPTTVPTIVSSEASTAPPTAPKTTVANPFHEVAAGDALFTIAQRYCTTADGIVQVNGWQDGLNHAILPGDRIVLPDDTCPNAPATTAAAVATTSTNSSTGTNPYLDEYIENRIVTDPFYPDGWGVRDEYGPPCDQARDAAVAFTTTGDESGLDVLDAAPFDLGEDDVVAMDVWRRFVREWYPRYEAITERTSELFSSVDGDEYFIALLSDPEYLDLLAAAENVQPVKGSLVRLVERICDPLFAP